jgi:hypothetical protein
MRKRGWISLLVCLLLIGGFWSVFVFFGPLVGWPPGFKLNARDGMTRPRNYHEWFYTQIAGYFGDATMCAKISNRAVDEELPSMETKWRVSFQRSECYFDAALKTKNEELCNLVKAVVTIPPNASVVSQSTCRKWLTESGSASFDPTPFFDPSAEIMHEMGYQDKDYYEARKENHPVSHSNQDDPVDWGAFYQDIRFGSSSERQRDFLRRAEGLPSFDD